MIQTKDTEKVAKNGFDPSKNICKLKAQNNTSTAHSAHAGQLGQSLEKAKKASEKLRKQADAPSTKEVKSKISGEKAKSGLQKSQKLHSPDGVKDIRNLKKDVKTTDSQAEVKAPNEALGKPKGLNSSKEDNQTKNSGSRSSSNEDTQNRGKHQADVSMSNEEKCEKSAKLCEKSNRHEENKEKAPSSKKQGIQSKPVQTNQALMKQLKKLISNPTPGIKSKFNNNICELTSYVDNYKATREKEISLANNSSDPLRQEDLKEGIKRARFIKLQAEKKEKLCPTIFDVSAMSAPATLKQKQQKPRGQKTPTNLRSQVRHQFFVTLSLFELI